METKSRFERYIFIVLWISLIALGVYAANRASQYEIVVKGVLGFAVLYLWFFYVKYSGVEISFDTMWQYPKIYNRLIFAFIIGSFSYLAVKSIIDMVIFLLRTWVNP